MALKFSGGLRKEYLARDILLTMLGSNPNLTSDPALKDGSLFELVNLSADMADSLLGKCQVFSKQYGVVMNSAETDGFLGHSSVVLDGELGDL